MPIDQSHRQHNADFRGDRGAIGLTEDSPALQKWMMAELEIRHFVANCKAMSGIEDVNQNSWSP